MAFGFGFNKTKVLASAEKNVKAGKLQNAIADYEKIVKEDPKDLNVLNTIGDLYARIGNVEQAVNYFRRAGDAWASDGFSMRAIAIYKKLTKLSPSTTDVSIKLADLLSQQGLHTEARSQYLQVAEQHLRAGELGRAANIFQKIVDLDPENSAMHAKLAELHLKLGKKAEARDLLFRNAELLRSSGQLQAADEALGKVLTIEPQFIQATLLRGYVKLELGDAAAAVELLDQVADIDSRPEGLRSLLRALLTLGRLEEAEPLSRKLLAVFSDISGITAYADALMASGDCEAAIRCYADNSDRLLASQAEAVITILEKSISKVKDNPAALEVLKSLLTKAGDTTHLAEVKELLAHAYVQQRELAKARDLYRELAELEPENPLHAQNYKQVLGKLGEETSPRVSPEQGRQALMVEELEESAPPLPQDYPADVALALKAALTDAELFDSYNLPSKAIAPLVAVLDRVPRDPNINQRLASLYARTDRFAEAAERCEVLSEVYREAGFESRAAEYAELAEKYSAQADTVRSAPEQCEAVSEPYSAKIGLVESQLTPEDRPSQTPSNGEASVAEFVFEEISPTETDFHSLEATMEPAAPSAPDESGPAAEVTRAETTPFSEIDLSAEWETLATSDLPDQSADSMLSGDPKTHDEAIWDLLGAKKQDNAGELAEEIQFYISQAMWDEAGAALDRLEIADSDRAALLRAELAECKERSGAISGPAENEPEMEVVQASEEPISADSASSATDPNEDLPDASTQALTSASPLGDFVLDLDASLGTDFDLGQPATQTVVPAPPTTAPFYPATVTTAAGMHAAAVAPTTVSQSASNQGFDLSALVEPEPEIAAGALSDIFAEFKSDMETGSEGNQDPETHYNLGVAFKEMGLLDEAIGELQKVCQAIERGHTFPQVLQAYTWLADCFLQKGVPEAAVRWYEKALKFAAPNAENSLAIHYELASAHEAAGDKASALKHFMEVYGANIDYRDVAERIKTLRA